MKDFGDKGQSNEEPAMERNFPTDLLSFISSLVIKKANRKIEKLCCC
jgi:hypothetical protein